MTDPTALLVRLDKQGNRKEIPWKEGCLCGQQGIVEIVFFRFPTQDELYALLPQTNSETKWRFAEHANWTIGGLQTLMGAYE